MEFKTSEKDKLISITDKNTVVIIDEIDDVLVDKQFRLLAAWNKATKNSLVRVIGLTATRREMLMDAEKALF